MSATSGYAGRFAPRKPITVTERTKVMLNEEEVAALRLECEAALREWDEEKAQTLFHIVEDESVSVAGDHGVRIPNQGVSG